MDEITIHLTAADREFYGGSLILLEGIISEFLSCLGMMRRYQTAQGLRDPVSSVQARIKSAASMREKLARQGLPVTRDSALQSVWDAAGVRLICPFTQNIDQTVALIRAIPGVEVLREKDYIRHPKPNGYRSYHMILSASSVFGQRTPRPGLAGGPASHHCHGLLGQHRAPAEIQTGYSQPGADYPGAETLRRRNRLHRSVPANHPGPDRAAARPGIEEHPHTGRGAARAPITRRTPYARFSGR